MRTTAFSVLGIIAIVIAAASTSTAGTTTVVPTTGLSASPSISSNSCSGQMWQCVNDTVGSADGDGTYVYKDSTATTGEHDLGYSGYANITSVTTVTMHVIAETDPSDPNAQGTVQMVLYNHYDTTPVLIGTGTAKPLTNGYVEYASLFDTSHSNITDLNTLSMHVLFANTGTSTGKLKYTAAWLTVTSGGAGNTLSGMDDCLTKSQTPQGDESDVSCGTTSYKVGSCTSAACAGGNGGTGLAVSHAAPPSPDHDGDNSAAKIDISAGSAPANKGASALETWKDNADTGSTDFSTSMQGQWWVYWTPGTSGNKPNTLEFDIFWGNYNSQTNQGHTAMFGTHCNFTQDQWEFDPQDGNANHVWQPVYDAKTHAPIPCKSVLTEGTWHQVIWQVHHDPNAGIIMFDYLTVDTTTYVIGLDSYPGGLFGYKNPAKQQFHDIGIQVQQDMNTAHQSFTEWVDDMTLTYW